MKNFLFLTCGFTLGFILGRDYGITLIKNVLGETKDHKKEMKYDEHR